MKFYRLISLGIVRVTEAEDLKGLNYLSVDKENIHNDGDDQDDENSTNKNKPLSNVDKSVTFSKSMLHAVDNDRLGNTGKIETQLKSVHHSEKASSVHKVQNEFDLTNSDKNSIARSPRTIHEISFKFNKTVMKEQRDDEPDFNNDQKVFSKDLKTDKREQQKTDNAYTNNLQSLTFPKSKYQTGGSINTDLNKTSKQSKMVGDIDSVTNNNKNAALKNDEGSMASFKYIKTSQFSVYEILQKFEQISGNYDKSSTSPLGRYSLRAHRKSNTISDPCEIEVTSNSRSNEILPPLLLNRTRNYNAHSTIDISQCTSEFNISPLNSSNTSGINISRRNSSSTSAINRSGQIQPTNSDMNNSDREGGSSGLHPWRDGRPSSITAERVRESQVCEIFKLN